MARLESKHAKLSAQSSIFNFWHWSKKLAKVVQTLPVVSGRGGGGGGPPSHKHILCQLLGFQLGGPLKVQEWPFGVLGFGVLGLGSGFKIQGLGFGL